MKDITSAKLPSSFNLVNEATRQNLNSSIKTYRNRFRNLLNPQDIKEIKQKASRIRDIGLKSASTLWEAAMSRLEENGVNVHFAHTNDEAIALLKNLLDKGKIIVKSKSNLLNEIGVLNAFDKNIIETDIGDWIVQQMGVLRIHPNAPAMGLSVNEIADYLSKRYGLRTDKTPEILTKEICKIIRGYILQAEVGLTGVNFVTSEGHLVIVENEGNVSLVTRFPQVHIAVVAYHRIVESLEEAVYLSKCLSMFGTGKSSTAYINIISSPSYTTDIEKTVVHGTQGAKEVHVIVIDNNRSQLLKNDKLSKALRCIGCGGMHIVLSNF